MKKQAVIFPLLVLVACEVAVQWHGWDFWNRHFDPTVGWVVSVMLGVLAASFWWQAAGPIGWFKRGIYGALALAATAVLLTGPFLEVTLPLQTALRQSLVLDERIDRLETQLETYHQNSQNRAGWLDEIQATKASMEDLEAKRLNTPAWWQSSPAILLQALALLILQMGAAVMAGWASRIWGADETGTETPETESETKAGAVSVESHPAETSPTPETTRDDEKVFQPINCPETAPSTETLEPAEMKSGTEMKQPTEMNHPHLDDFTIRRLQQTLSSKIKIAGISARKWCDSNQVNPRDLSFLANHFKRVEEGKETISTPKLHDLAGRFLPSDEAVQN